MAKGAVSRHPTADSCFAWSVPASENSGERFYAVLRTAEVDTAEKVLRASIVADHRRAK